MALTIKEEMQSYFSELTEVEQKSVLQLIKTFLAAREIKGRVSIEQYNEEIDEALADVATGNYITQADLEKESIQWQKR